MSEDPLDLLLLKSPSTHHAAASTEREDELMVQLQDAKMYAAALEFKLLESKTHTDHVKETLLRELMVYKREHLQDRTSHLYEAGLQSTLTRIATSDKEYVNHSRTLQSKIDVGSDRCKRLTSIVMTLKEKMTLNEQAHADAMRVQSAQHREQVDQLEAEALQLRTRIVACTGRRFVEKCAVAKTQLAELRDNLREVRGTLVHFQQEIASGVVARRRSTLRGERWNRSTSATSSSFRALGNRSGSRSGGEGKSPLRNGQRQSAVNLMNPGDIQRTNTVVFHTDDVQDVTGDDTPESSSPNTVCPPNNNNNTIGMMGRIMNVITTAAEQQQKVEAREKILVNMFEGLMPLLDPRSAMLWEQSRRSPDDLELLTEASTSASEHLRSELETLQKKCATLTAANASLDKDRMALARQCDTLRQQIPEKKQLVAVSTLTAVDASNWEFLVGSPTMGSSARREATQSKATQCPEIGGGGDETPHKRCTPPPQHSSSSSQPAALNPQLLFENSPRSKGQSPRSVVKTAGVASSDQASPSLSSTPHPDIAEAQTHVWLEESADLHRRHQMLRDSMVTWLRRYRDRKQKSLDAFLMSRVAPFLNPQSQQASRRPRPGSSPRNTNCRSSDTQETTADGATMTITVHQRSASARPSSAKQQQPPQQFSVAPPQDPSSARGRVIRGSSMARRPMSGAAEHPLPMGPIAAPEIPKLDWLEVNRLAFHQQQQKQ